MKAKKIWANFSVKDAKRTNQFQTTIPGWPVSFLVMTAL